MRQYHHVEKTALENAGSMKDGDSKVIVSQFGAVLPLAMTHSEVGAREASKFSSVAWFMYS